MPIGYLILSASAILVFFGVGQRLLDRMRLNDRWALVLMVAMILGGLLPDIPLGGNFSINVGGALIPIGLCVYLFIKAGTVKEKVRSIVASVLAAAAVVGISYLMPSEPETMWIDPLYIYGLVGGLIAYVLGRSRRAAFIAGIMGIILADTYQGIANLVNGVAAPTRLGGGGAFDSVLISGFLAVILAELIGEIREKAQGGTAHTDQEFKDGEFVPVRNGRDNDEE